MSDRALGEILAHLEECPDLCEVDYSAVQPDLSADDLVYLLVAIRDARAAYATLYDVVQKELLANMGEKQIVVDGVGEVEVKHATKRTQWDHEQLIPAVVGRLADEPGMFFDPDDGVLLPFQTIGHNVARRLRECVSFGAGKVTGLREVGIDPSEYCVEEYGKAQIKLPKREL